MRHGAARLAVIVVVAAGALALLTGCGSSPSERQSFISQANAICKHAYAAGAGIGQRFHSTSEVTRRLEAADQRELAKLSRLTPPADLRAEYQKYLTVTRSSLKDATPIAARIISQLRSGQAVANPGGTRALAKKVKAELEPSASLAKKLGLSDCAHPNASATAH